MVLILDGSSEHGANIFRVVQGIWLLQKSRQIQIIVSEKTYFTICVRNMFWATILYKYPALRFPRVNDLTLNSCKIILSFNNINKDELGKPQKGLFLVNKRRGIRAWPQRKKAVF